MKFWDPTVAMAVEEARARGDPMQYPKVESDGFDFDDHDYCVFDVNWLNDARKIFKILNLISWVF